MFDKDLLNQAFNGNEDDLQEFVHSLLPALIDYEPKVYKYKEAYPAWSTVLVLAKEALISNPNNSNALHLAAIASELEFTQNGDEAAKNYYEKAVSLGNALSMITLAHKLQYTDRKKSLQLCDNAIKRGYAQAHYLYGQLCGDYLLEFKHYRQAFLLGFRDRTRYQKLTEHLKSAATVRNLYELEVGYEAAIALDLKKTSEESYLLKLKEQHEVPTELLCSLAYDEDLSDVQRLNFVALLLQDVPHQKLEDYIAKVYQPTILEMFAKYYTWLGQDCLAKRLDITKSAEGNDLPHADTKYKPALEYFARAISYFEKSKQKINQRNKQYDPYYGIAVLMYQSACKAFGSDNNELAVAVIRAYFEKGIQAGSSDCLEFYIDAIGSVIDQDKPLEMEDDEKYTFNNFNTVKQAYQKYRGKLSAQDKQLEKIIEDTHLYDIFNWDKKNLADVIDIQFGAVTLEIPKEIHALHDLIRRTDISTESKLCNIQATLIKMQTGIDYWQEEKKGIVFNTVSGGLILGGIGITLVATGILAPIGGVLVGIAVAALMGSALGAAIGGLVSKAVRKFTACSNLSKLYDGVIRNNDNTKCDTNTYASLMANVASRNAELVDGVVNKQPMEDIIRFVELQVNSKQKVIEPAQTDEELPLLRCR